MADLPDGEPSEEDFERASVARVYDYLLGGSHNFAVDRAAAHRLVEEIPEIAAGVRAGRSFLRRAVRLLAESGIDQFLDLGSGIPAGGNVHEIARQVTPDARVVYVDRDPVAVAHGNTLLAGLDGVAMVRADLREPDQILTAPQVRELLDLRRPVGILLVSVLQYVPEQGEGEALVIGRYRDAVAPGSYLVASMASQEVGERNPLASVVNTCGGRFFLRNRDQVERLFDGFELVEPGVVPVSKWRPDPVMDADGAAAELLRLAGVGRRPATGD